VLPSRDSELVQIVDASFADAARRAQKADGESWLACRAGCTPCCHGVFRISALDAERLRSALHELEQVDRARAEAIRERATRATETLQANFPGDPSTGVLEPEETGRWEEFADLPEADGPCPVLDPATGRCELYVGRPLTCRIFGPPVMQEEGIGVCELCFVGASEAEVLRGEMKLSHQELEEELDKQMPAEETVIAWALLQSNRGGTTADSFATLRNDTQEKQG
jgi:Fe-S-cluster containining protein